MGLRGEDLDGNLLEKGTCVFIQTRPENISEN